MSDIVLQESKFLPHQWEFMRCWERTVGLIAGLGAGKSVALLSKVLIALVSRPGSSGRANIGVGYPTYGMAELIFFYPFCETLDRLKIKYKRNLAKLQIYTTFGDISMISMQHPERIIGASYTDMFLDELDTMPRPKGEKVVRKSRERLRGRKDSSLSIVSSPEGFSTCYEVLQNNPNPGTHAIRATTYSNIYLPQGYIDDIRASYDERMIAAYLRGEYVNLVGLLAHYAFDRDKHVGVVQPPDSEHDRFKEIHIGMDFNVHPMTACVGYDIGDVYNIYNEYYLLNSNTYQMADILADDYRQRDVIIYPDPTGTHRKTSSDTSDIKILQAKGFGIRFRHGMTQRQSLNATNGAFAHNRIKIDPSCKHLIEDLEQVVTDEYGQISKPASTMLTHISDAMRNKVLMDLLMKQEAAGWGRR